MKGRLLTSLALACASVTLPWSLAVAASPQAAAAPAVAGHKPPLQLAYTSPRIWNGVAVADDGRVFAAFPYWGGGADQGPTVAELAPDGKATPYPDAGWNGWKRGVDPQHSFVRVNAIRIGPHGHLWVVDAGEASLSTAIPAGSKAARAKLVEIDLQHNKVIRVIDLAAGSTARSYIDDIRFWKNHAFLTDAGDPGLVVLDLDTGAQRRVLQRIPATTDRRPMVAEGKMLISDGHPTKIHADQLEVSPDGEWLYFQASSGPMYRIRRQDLENTSLSPAELDQRVRFFYDTPTTGGTAIDGDGNLYVSDVNTLKILKITPQGRASTLIADPRLVWADAMWIDNHGKLWIPAVQLNRTPSFQNGVDKVHYPVAIYTLDLGLKPFR